MQPEIKRRMEMIKKGEVPKGYRKTKVGIIPNDWNIKRLYEIAEINKTSLRSTTSKDYSFKYYDLSSVDNGKIEHVDEWIAFKDAPSRAKRIFRKNDILMSTVRPYLKGFAKVDFDAKDCICSTGFAVLSSKIKSDTDYIYYNLFSYNVEKQIDRLLVGSNYPAINNNDVNNIKIPYPRNKIDREIIGSVFSTWDKAIELKEKLIEQKKEQKKGIAQNLLTGKIRLSGFKDKWKKVKLGEVISEVNDRTTENNQYPVLTSSRQGIFLQEDYFKKSVASTNNIGYKILRKNQFTYRTMSDDGNFVFNQLKDYDIGIVSPAYVVFKATHINEVFLKNLLNSYGFKKYIIKYVQGGTRLSLRYKNLKDITIPLSTREEQDAIGEVLSIVELEIQLLEQELQQLKQQKKGLMQLLLTGIVRVNDLDI